RRGRCDRPRGAVQGDVGCAGLVRSAERMKLQVSSALKSFLTATPPPTQISFADCYTFTLTNGDVLRYTSFARDVYIGGSSAHGSGTLFTSMSDRLVRGQIKNVR